MYISPYLYNFDKATHLKSHDRNVKIEKQDVDMEK